jgi:FdrA protein
VSARYLRGLFCGGTLADEAMLIAAETLGPVRSNIPLTPDLALGADLASNGHTVIDFGDDRMTQGRPHPMIDPSRRLECMAAEARDPDCGVLLLDLVLGYSAHPDPAGELAEAIAGAKATARGRGADLPVVVSLVGVESDPQGLTRSAEPLRGAGAAVFLSNARATRQALALLGHPAQGTEERS